MKKLTQPDAFPVKVSYFKRPKKPVHIKHIVILGDSVAYGYGTKGGIAKYLKETFPESQVTNLGINGLTSTGLVERLRSGVWNKTMAEADLVLLNIGGNDLLRSFRYGGAKGLLREFSALKRTYRKNLLEVYAWIRSQTENAVIVQNSLYNSMKKEAQYFGFTSLLFKLWNSAIGEKGVIISRLDGLSRDRSVWLDSIHPNDDGYKLMHDLLMETLSGAPYVFPTAKKFTET